LKLKNEISSTEKLLDLIRSKNQLSDREPPEKGFETAPARKNSFPSKESLFRKSITVGVDLGRRNLKLVKIDDDSGAAGGTFSYETITYPDDVNRDSAQFSEFLGGELRRFCGGSSKVNVWSVLPFDKVEIQSINIPQVPKKQMENAIFWTSKKEMGFDDEYIFDYEVKGDIIDRGIQKTAIIAMAAPKIDVQKFNELFSASGYPLAGITLAPFTIQNLLSTNWLPSQDTVASIYIGWDFSRIDIFSKGVLVAVRSVKTGTNGLIESLKDSIDKKIKGIDISLALAERILCKLSPDYSEPEKDKVPLELAEEEVFEMIKPALGRIVTQLEMTFKNYSSNLENENVGKIFVSTAMPIYKPIIDYIGQQLGIEADILDPLPSDIGMETAPRMLLSERTQFALCLGLALSDNSRTPNLLFTFKEKREKSLASRVNKAIIAACIFMLLAGMGYYSWQKFTINSKKSELASFERRLGQFGVTVDQNAMLQMLAHLKQQQQQVTEYLSKYRGIILLGEVSTLTPVNVKLLNIKASLNPVATEKDKEPKRSVSIEGIVTGNKDALEAGLAEYVSSLKSSPVISQATIEKKIVEKYRSENVLHFNLDLKLS
jgi:Tfp pilus assembly PilM family ATPase